MAQAIDILKIILDHVRFSPQNGRKDSYYMRIGNTFVRISNHCTRLYVWDNYFRQNQTLLRKLHEMYGKIYIVSIVFEDGVNTYNDEQCRTLKHPRRNPIIANEYVYDMTDDRQLKMKPDIQKIIADIQNIKDGLFSYDKSKCEYFQRESVNPSTDASSTAESTNESYLNSLIDCILTEQLRRLYAKQQRKLWR